MVARHSTFIARVQYYIRGLKYSKRLSSFGVDASELACVAGVERGIVYTRG